MNYKYYIVQLFFISFFSLSASDTPIKRPSVKEIQLTYAKNTRNTYLIQKQQQQLTNHSYHEQFKKDIKTIKEWNSQEEGNSAGGAVGRIAKNIETLKSLSSYKDFQTLDLSKILERCATFKYYNDIPAGDMSNLQKILIALAPHNTSVFDFYSTAYLRTIVPKQRVINNPSPFTVDATANVCQITKIIPVSIFALNQEPQQSKLPSSEHQRQTEERQQATSAEISPPENQIPEDTSKKTEITQINEHESTHIHDQAEQKLSTEVTQKTATPDIKEEKVTSIPSYKRPLFLGLGFGICTLIFAIYYHYPQYCDKESLTHFFNNPQHALTFLRAIVSRMAR